MLGPILYVGRAINTVSTIYVVGQVGWMAVKELRKMRAEMVRSEDIRARFIQQYKEKHDGQVPDEELVKMALDAASAVDKPLQHRATKFIHSAADNAKECVNAVADLASSFISPKKEPDESDETEESERSEGDCIRTIPINQND